MEKQIVFQFQHVECPEPVEGRAWIYILECNNKSLYVGSTTNIPQRLKDHVVGRGSLWTKRFSPFRLVYTQEYASYSEAVRRERQVKRWSLIKKIKLIEGIWK